MKKFLISQTNKNIKRLFGIAKKNLNFTWQREEPNNKKKIQYLNEEEREKFNIRKEKKKLKEDYRLKIFDIGLNPEKAEIIPDEIFGTENIQKKLFENANIVEVYKNSNYKYKNTLLTKKLSYLKEIVPEFKLENPHLSDQVETLNSYILKEINDKSKMQYSDWEKIYNKPEIKEELMKLAVIIKSTTHKDIPNLLLKLCFELNYTLEYIIEVKIYKIIEDLIHLNFHIFNTKELAVIFFGLTAKMPKRGSIFLRKKIKDYFLKLDFKKIDVHDVMIIFTAFRMDKNCDQIHRKCFNFFLKEKKTVENLSKVNQGLPLDVLFTFANCRLENRYRKKFKEKNDFDKEGDKILDLYYPMILKNFSFFYKEDILRLLHCIEKLKMNGFDELYIKIERYLLRNLKNYHFSELSYIIYTGAKANQFRGIFSREFWKKIPFLLKKNNLLNFQDANSCIEFLGAFTMMKAIDIKSFNNLFGDEFYSLVEKTELSFRELSILTDSFCYLNIFDEKNDSLKKFFKLMVYKLSKKDEWVPIFQAPQIKIFLNYIKNIYPNWNLEFIENLLYHSEKRMSGYKMREKSQTGDYQNLSHTLSRLDTNFISFLPYKNFYILDYVIEERKLCMNLIKESDLLFSANEEVSEIQPRMLLKNNILLKDDWTVCLIDFREFEGLEDKSGFLKERIEESYKLTFEKTKRLHYEKRLEILNYQFELGKYLYHDKKYKEIGRRREIIENIQENFNKEYKE